MSSCSSITEILGISDKNLKIHGGILKKELNHIEYNVLQATLTYTPSHCEKCGCINENHSIVKNGSQKTKILINRVNVIPTLLEIKKQRFLCRECNSTFTARSSIVEEGCFISNYVKTSILKELSKKQSMTDIAENHYVSPSSVLRVLKTTDTCKSLFNLPTKIGIDEFKSTKRVDAAMSVNITDHDTGEIFDIVPDRRKNSIFKYFESFSEEARAKVEIVTTDMYPAYIETSKKLFSNAKIVIDKFHIVQLFTRAMNCIRINEMKRFNKTSREYKILKKYWKIPLAKDWELNGIYFYKYTHYKKLTNSKAIKRDIHKFSDTMRNADNFYQEVLTAIYYKKIEDIENVLERGMRDIPEEFRVCIRTLKKYKEYFINAIETEYSNGRVEANNNIIKVYKRLSFGYRSFSNMRCRVLLRYKFRLLKKPEYQQYEKIMALKTEKDKYDNVA